MIPVSPHARDSVIRLVNQLLSNEVSSSYLKLSGITLPNSGLYDKDIDDNMPSTRASRALIESSKRISRTQICTRELQRLQMRSISICRDVTTQAKVPTLPYQQAIIFSARTTLRRHASTSSTELKLTPLYQVHKDAGAKFGPFAGYDMPLEYPDQSHPESHRWTRSNASLFDVSHMVQHKLSGPLAEEFLLTITPTSIHTLQKHHSS